MAGVNSNNDLYVRLETIVRVVLSGGSLSCGRIIVLIQKSNAYTVATDDIATQLVNTDGPWLDDHEGWNGLTRTLENLTSEAQTPECARAVRAFWNSLTRLWRGGPTSV